MKHKWMLTMLAGGLAANVAYAQAPATLLSPGTVLTGLVAESRQGAVGWLSIWQPTCIRLFGLFNFGGLERSFQAHFVIDTIPTPAGDLSTTFHMPPLPRC